nr:cellulose binding domain-containing protein [Actinoplanes friuliensis]
MTAVFANGAGPKNDAAKGVEPTTLTGSNKCVVSYAVWSDSNNRFKAAVTIANRDTKAIKDWKLWFVMPGDQVVSGNGKLKLDQQGQGVTVSSKTVLSPQQTQTLQFSGRYVSSNAAPMLFELGGTTCQTFVSPAPGEPSRPVEHLTNGTVRLGPVPTKDTPIPGISINPSGVAVPVPVTSSNPAGGVVVPTTAPTTAATPGPTGTGDDDDDNTGGDGAVVPGPPDPPTTPPTTQPTTEPPTSPPTTAPEQTYTEPSDQIPVPPGPPPFG